MNLELPLSLTFEGQSFHDPGYETNPSVQEMDISKNYLNPHNEKYHTTFPNLDFSDSGYGGSSKGISFAATSLSLDGKGHESLDTLVKNVDELSRSKADDDLGSVISDTEDISSRAPNRMGVQEVAAEKILAALSARNEELRPLCEEVLRRAGK